MRVLLLGMPDVASCFDSVMRIPNLGIASIAANIEADQVRVLDLVLHPRGIAKVVARQVQEFRPDVVGLSAMTFQYDTAKEVASVVRRALPDTKIILGGYHATLAFDSISQDPEADVFDFLVRGEGEVSMNRLIRCLDGHADYEWIPGISYRANGRFVHNAQGPLVDLEHIGLPARKSRISNGFTYFGKPYDVVETSRGCLKPCRFCSIRRMYGRSHRAYPVERVVRDISDARANGAKGIFFVDDNINLRLGRLRELCEAIVEAGLDDLEYITQADVAGFADEPDLPKAMRRAGFTGVFLGIESTSPENWEFLKKRNPSDVTAKVVRSLREHDIGVAGGFIIGNPYDDEAAVRAAFRTALRLPLDHAIMWCLTPYPGTEVRESMLDDGLVENVADFRTYNGFICNVRTKHLSQPEIVRLIAQEGAKLYFNPRFFLRSRAWPRSPGTAWRYFRTVFEYVSRAPHNRLFASRHRM